MAINAYERYKNQSVMTMTQGEMLSSLYNEAIKQMSRAIVCIENDQSLELNDSVRRVIKILGYLTETLDFKYEVSNQLKTLYDFFAEQMLEANIKKDVSYISPIIGMITEMRDTFVQAEKSLKK